MDSPSLLLLGRALGPRTDPFIYPVEGWGDGSKEAAPASYWELPDSLATAAGTDLPSTNTRTCRRRRPPCSTSPLQFLPPSCCSSCPTGSFCKHSLGDYFFFFTLRVAGRQRSRNPPARCRTAKNPALQSELSALRRTPETFSITTFQPQTSSCSKGNRQKPAKTPGKGERVIPQGKADN